jgi:hypothetical protein
MRIEDVAKICHEANKALCETQGDGSQVSFEDAPDWQRVSAMKGVEFNLYNPDAHECAAHDEWMKEKIEAGWKYGPVKDSDKKEHPCLVPFEELPIEQQAKDILFKAIENALSELVV